MSDVIAHDAPTVCITVPTFDARLAIHNARNSGTRSGVHGLFWRATVVELVASGTATYCTAAEAIVRT